LAVSVNYRKSRVLNISNHLDPVYTGSLVLLDSLETKPGQQRESDPAPPLLRRPLGKLDPIASLEYGNPGGDVLGQVTGVGRGR
jgi:hypothetical protein